MIFIDYYQSIKNVKERRNLRNRIAVACGAQVPTFYSWIRRNSFPLLVKEKIAKILDLPQGELFPTNVVNNILNNIE